MTSWLNARKVTFKGINGFLNRLQLHEMWLGMVSNKFIAIRA